MAKSARSALPPAGASAGPSGKNRGLRGNGGNGAGRLVGLNTRNVCTHLCFVGTPSSLHPPEQTEDVTQQPYDRHLWVGSHCSVIIQEDPPWVTGVELVPDPPKLLCDPDLRAQVRGEGLGLPPGGHCTEIMVEGLARRTRRLC